MPNVPAGQVNILGHMHRSLKPAGSPHINVLWSRSTIGRLR